MYGILAIAIALPSRTPTYVRADLSPFPYIILTPVAVQENSLTIHSLHIYIFCLIIDAAMQYALSVFRSTWELDPLPSLSSCLLFLLFFLVISGIVVLPITAQEVKDCSAEAFSCQTIDNSILDILESDHPHEILSGGEETQHGLSQHLKPEGGQLEQEQIRHCKPWIAEQSGASRCPLAIAQSDSSQVKSSRLMDLLERNVRLIMSIKKSRNIAITSSTVRNPLFILMPD